jgi:hypothetical protein
MFSAVQYLGKEANAMAKKAIVQGMAWALAHAQLCRDSIPDGNKYLGLLNKCDPTPHVDIGSEMNRSLPSVQSPMYASSCDLLPCI